MSVTIEDIYPLSPLQAEILFHTLDAPDSGVWVNQLICTLRGDLDLSAFSQSWQAVVDRHQTLRASFHWEEAENPVQVVQQSVKLPIAYLNWVSLAEHEQQQRLEALIEADRALGFDLSEAPLMRLTLIRLTDDTYSFIWSLHHLLLDGWSERIVFKEVFLLYEALSENRPGQLPPPPPYSDYIAWLRRQDLSAAETFWRTMLRGFTEPISLPLEIAAPRSAATGERKYGEQNIRLSETITSALRTFARAHRLTVNTIFEGAWALLLSHYSGRSDVLFGAMVSGRPAELTGVESIVGLFINALPVRTEIPSQGTTLSWLMALQSQREVMTKYGYAPLNAIQGWSEVPRGHCLFDTILVFENYRFDASLRERRAAIELRYRRSLEETNYGLTAVAVPGPRLACRISYDRSRYRDESIERLLGHFVTLIEGIVAGAQRPVRSLCLLAPTEREQIVHDWNDTSGEYQEKSSVSQLFEAQVTRTPDAVAVVSEGAQLTYRDLNRRANQVAQRLRRLGVGPEISVGICAERSLEMVVGVLGVLKAGGIYVPLDPSNPRDRLSFMLADAQVSVVLTQERMLDLLPWQEAQVLCLDRDWQLIEQEGPEQVASGVGPDNLAYIIYTSGSTGTPKGIGIPHCAIVRLVVNTNYLQLTPRDRVAQASTFSFDAATFEIWGALLHGACLVQIDKDTILVPDDFARAISEKGISTLFLTTALFNQFARDVPSAFRSLSHVLFGGEAVDPQSVRRVLVHGRPRHLLHVYGPTESTTFATWYEVREVAADAATVPIGRGIANTELYVLDAWQEPVPIEVPGELYIGGAGLGRGYLHRPALTAERFVPHPFSTTPGERLYRTGDRVRWLPDGTLEFLGRLDEQVKIRGFRIELGEIEAVLRQHPAVAEAVVIAQEEGGSKRLVAYVVPVSGQQPGATVLRPFLQERLPDYMLPATVVLFERLPLSAHGKVDRRALPRPEQSPAAGETHYTSPRTVVEEQLAGIWAEVLGLAAVGIHDNFFALGGDSILSIQIASRARQLGWHITSRHVFEHSTIAELGVVMTRIQSVQAEQGPVLGRVPLTPIQRWFFEQDLLDSHHFNMSLLFTAREALASSALEKAISHLLAHHDALRFRFAHSASGWEQVGTDVDNIVPFSRYNLVGIAEDARRAAIETHAARIQASLDIASGPLIRIALFEFGPGEPNRLLVVIHHLVVDGVSWRILLEDLEATYEQLCRGMPVQLPAKRTSYRQWAMCLTGYAHSADQVREVAYWLGVPPADPGHLPVDCPGGAEHDTVGSARTVTVELSRERTGELLRSLPAIYDTQINDVLIAALVRACHAWTGRTALFIDLEGHGREELFDDVDLSRTVGWFTSIFPALIDLGGAQTPTEAVSVTKQQLRTIPARGIGYGILRYLHADPEVAQHLRALPQPEISFNYLGQFDQVLSGSHLLQLAPESPGLDRSGRGTRRHLLEIDGWVMNGRLQMTCTYSEHIHHRATMIALMEQYMAVLEEFIVEGLRLSTGHHTPLDFPDSGLNQAELDSLLAKLH